MIRRFAPTKLCEDYFTGIPAKFPLLVVPSDFNKEVAPTVTAIFKIWFQSRFDMSAKFPMYIKTAESTADTKAPNTFFTFILNIYLY